MHRSYWFSRGYRINRWTRPHFFLSFCFFSGLRFCSAVATARGMISTLPSALYCSEYSLGG